MRRAAVAGLLTQKSVALSIARRTRLVATGFLPMKSRLPPSMQQKYCDQGRSTELLTITCPMLRARNSCGSGGKPRNASTFPWAKSSMGGIDVLVIQRMSLAGSSPTWAAMVDKNRCGDVPNSGMATVLPLRLAMFRAVRVQRHPQHREPQGQDGGHTGVGYIPTPVLVHHGRPCRA